jgi:predicted GNAT family acetyltransferase
VPDIAITRELTGAGGRYVGRIEGVEGEAELTFIRPQPALLIADHTGTPHSMRGMGAASALVERLVADARREGFKIVPQCPFVKAQFDRHPDWADLLA